VSGSNAIDQGRERNGVARQPGAIPSEHGIYLFDLDTRLSMRVADLVPLKPGIAVSPDGTMIAYQGTDQTGQQVLYVANVDGTNVRALEETASTGVEPILPRFSPDGSQIVYQAKGGGVSVGDLFLVDVSTGQTTQLTDLKKAASGLYAMAPSFSPDGKTVLFHRPHANYSDEPSNFLKQSWDVWSVPATGGRPELLLRNAVGARLSPDGRTIIYFKSSHRDPFIGDMWVADTDGTDTRILVRGGVATLSAEWSPDATRIAYARWAGGRGTYVVGVTTGETSNVLDGAYFPEWVDDHTLIVGSPIR
jgi:Tol biopolymer transport system component